MDLNQDETQRVAEINAMKRTATLVLLGVTALFVIGRTRGNTHPTLWGYVTAFAEAAMVGGLADWFAVTAMFRHPLGIPIPHTNIVASRKDQLAKTFGSFVQTSFLAPEVLRTRLSEISVAEKLSEWLTAPGHAQLVAEKAGSVAATVVRLLDDDEVGDLVATEVLGRLKDADIAPVASKVLELLTEQDRHHQLLDAALDGLDDMLGSQRTVLWQRFLAESPWWVPEAVDERVFDKIFSGLRAFLGEVRRNPHHEFRQHLDSRVQSLIGELRDHRPAADRLNQAKQELLSNPSVHTWATQSWIDLRERVIAASGQPGSSLMARLEKAVHAFAHALDTDPALRERIDSAAVDIAVTLADNYRDEVAGFVETTMRSWDAEETSLRVEMLLGRDLQIIRINGSVVGGLAGLVIHALGQLLT